MQEQLRYQKIKKANLISSFVNLFLAVIKTTFGILGKSPALLADGIHSFSDLLANLLVWLASFFGKAAPDLNHPYGHHRFETVGSFTLGLFLVLIALGIAYDAIDAIIMHHLPTPNAYTAWVAVISIIANECVFRYTVNTAKNISSSLLKANAYHSRADSLSSIIVLVGILGALAGFPFFDAIAAVLVAGFVAKIGVQLAWQAIYELTDAAVSPEEVAKIETLILGLSGVHQMHRLRTRKMADKIFLDVHILIAPYSSASEGHYIGETVRFSLMQAYPSIEDITIHIDTEDHAEKMPEALFPSRRDLEAAMLVALEPELTAQDILRLDLFYFEKHIELELILKANVLDKKTLQEWQVFVNKALSQIKEIKKSGVAIEA